MIAAQLADLIGPEQVTADAEALAGHRFDRWCLKHWQDWQGEVLDTPACVVRPRDATDVQKVLRFAAEHDVPLKEVQAAAMAEWRQSQDAPDPAEEG